MRFLHTGDWHVGKPLKGRSRLDEHVQVLDEIVGIARAERVDALLVGGDVPVVRAALMASAAAMTRAADSPCFMRRSAIDAPA